MLLSCPLQFVLRVFSVSPTYCILQTAHVITQTTLLDLQVKWPLILHLFCLDFITEVSYMCWQVLHLGLAQGWLPLFVGFCCKTLYE